MPNSSICYALMHLKYQKKKDKKTSYLVLVVLFFFKKIEIATMHCHSAMKEQMDVTFFIYETVLNLGRESDSGHILRSEVHQLRT